VIGAITHPITLEKTTMKLQHIELNQLKVSSVNARKRGAEEDLGEASPASAALGSSSRFS
jgi:hypothetical protein